MIEAAKILSLLAVLSAAASLFPRWRRLMRVTWVCVLAVGLCLGVDVLRK